METEGLFAPESEAQAQELYEEVAPAAGEVVRAVAKEMSFDRDEYQDRVGGDVVDTAREAIFASLLEVHVGTRAEYEQWCDDHESDPIELGTETVDHVVWHAAPFAERVLAATYQNEREAAIATLRRQAFGRFYHDVLPTGEDDE